MNPVIPAPVPVPLPAPVWLLQLLLVFTFVLHLAAMNFLVGGSAILAVSSWRCRSDPRHRELTRRACTAMPPVVAFTITLGVAPLLFLQLVYGQLFYTSSVIMAWSWLSVVGLLMLGYYGVYGYALQHDELGPRALWVAAGVGVAFLLIAMIFTQNMSLMLRPQDFYSLYLSKTVGNHLGSFQAVTLTRFLHFAVAAMAIAGLGLALLSRRWQADSPDFAAWARGYGVRWFLAASGVEIVVGFGFLFALPPNIRASFLGRDTLSTSILSLGIVLAVLAMLAARKSLAVACVAIFGTISLMAVVRHLVRVAYLRPYFDPHTLPVSGQWFVFALFALLLVAGIATLAWMLYQFFRPAATGEVSAGDRHAV